MKVKDKLLGTECEANEVDYVWFVISHITSHVQTFSKEEFKERFEEIKVEAKRPTLEEMNARKCREPNVKFKVITWSSEFNRWVGFYKDGERDEWYVTSWFESGINADESENLDLIEKPLDWSEDVSVFRYPVSLKEAINSVPLNPTSHTKYFHWKERRYYREENGVTKFICSEVIDG